MASSSVPAAAAAANAMSRAPSPSPSTNPPSQLCPNRHGRISFPFPLKSKTLSSSKVLGVDGNGSCFVRKAKLDEMVDVSNDVPKVVSKLGDSEREKEPASATPKMTPEAISEFMSQVSSLVKLVDSKDVIELQLKQPGCELIIRKKEALPQPPAPGQVMMMPSHGPPPVAPSPYAALPPPPAPAAQTSPPALPASSPPAAKPEAPKSSHPPLKSPMAGTFYRSPAPGQPPFVKVGDKVKKGQVLCIIEAMKLMNEIEADHAGTVIDILADDAKPVGVEQVRYSAAEGKVGRICELIFNNCPDATSTD